MVTQGFKLVDMFVGRKSFAGEKHGLDFKVGWGHRVLMLLSWCLSFHLMMIWSKCGCCLNTLSNVVLCLVSASPGKLQNAGSARMVVYRITKSFSHDDVFCCWWGWWWRRQWIKGNDKKIRRSCSREVGDKVYHFVIPFFCFVSRSHKWLMLMTTILSPFFSLPSVTETSVCCRWRSWLDWREKSWELELPSSGEEWSDLCSRSFVDCSQQLAVVSENLKKFLAPSLLLLVSASFV